MSNQARQSARASAKYIIVLPTTHHTLLAEKALHAANVRSLTVPKPQKAVSDCGLALQIEPDDLHAAMEILTARKMRFKVFAKKADGDIEPLKSNQED
jgi:hypothetical protein